ncbi:MAG TPA: 7-cyano-7-deazaguanine synthase [Lacipirellulaceae bacterium]|nr:7-cyano-7-deazaguanine synthase [Lacipirellulaceae bacterium]
MDSEHIFSCGGLSVNGGDAPAIKLNLWGGGADENVQLRIEDLHGTLYRNIPPEYQDLVEIATYVYCADQAATRSLQDTDRFGSSWRRHMRLHIPVRRPEFWSKPEITESLVRLLNFLSDDFYTFEFSKASSPPGFQQYLDLGKEVPSSPHVEQVAMFSGGLDSLAGAVNALKIERKAMAFVTHSSTPKNIAALKLLRRKLDEVATGPQPLYVTIRVNKKKNLGREYTQRTRSFLFAALGSTVARMLGTRSLQFFENGVVSMNLPVCAQVVGGRATRTTHPRVLADMSALFSLVQGEPFAVENPFFWETKGEVIKRIVAAGCGEMIAHSISCAHTWERTREHTHCGGCSQCIDRRFGILAAEADTFDPSGHYKSDVFTESRPIDEDRILIASYIERARKLKDLKSTADLIAAYPSVARSFRYLGKNVAGVAQRVLDLHYRHAAEIESVLKKMITQHAGDLLDHKLPGDCLLRVAIDRSVSSVAAPSNSGTPRNFMWRRGNVWEIRYAGGSSFLVSKHQRGCAFLQQLLRNPGRELTVHEILSDTTLLAFDDVLDGKISSAELRDGFAESFGIPLSDGGEAVDATALRACRERLSELRDELAEAKEANDDEKRAAVESEMDEIASYLKSSTGKDGRARKINDQRKRQRDAFRNSLTRTIEEIGGHDEQLHAHLKASLVIGVKSVYSPKEPTAWTFSAPADVLIGKR